MLSLALVQCVCARFIFLFSCEIFTMIFYWKTNFLSIFFVSSATPIVLESVTLPKIKQYFHYVAVIAYMNCKMKWDRRMRAKWTREKLGERTFQSASSVSVWKLKKKKKKILSKTKNEERKKEEIFRSLFFWTALVILPQYRTSNRHISGNHFIDWRKRYFISYL